MHTHICIYCVYVTCEAIVNVSAGKIILIDFAKQKECQKNVPINLRAKAIKTFAFIIN